MSQKSVMKSQQGLADIIWNRALLIIRAVFEVHQHVYLQNNVVAKLTKIAEL